MNIHHNPSFLPFFVPYFEAHPLRSAQQSDCIVQIDVLAVFIIHRNQFFVNTSKKAKRAPKLTK